MFKKNSNIKRKHNPLVNNKTEQLELVGKKICFETIENPETKINIIKVITTKKNQSFIDKCIQNNINYEITNSGWFNKKFHNINHQNCLIILKSTKQLTIAELIDKVKNLPKTLILVLDHIHDDYNYGSILRTAAALNVTAVVVPNDRQSKINSIVIKTSAGMALKLDIVSVPNLNQTIDKFKKNNCWVYSASCESDSKNISDINFSNHCVLILGNEGNGISDLLLKNSDFKIKIPINPAVESLNVGHASAILMYEIGKKINLI